MPPIGNQAVVALVFIEEKFILLKRRTRDDDPWSGDYCLPGGFVKIRETLLEATKREFTEETGIDGEYLEFQFSLHPLNPFSRGELFVYPSVFKLNGNHMLILGDEMVWGDFVSMSDFKISTDAIKGNQLIKGEITIWGLTQRIIRECFKALDLDYPRS
ncbi:Nudix hydrolase family protein [mine drainage metagenome]|uniref:Nudix hydrolase family protein n=1 Tax=mine drainage metagenome TaxID=410659 RepID=T0ZIT1_9ZZZZ